MPTFNVAKGAVHNVPAGVNTIYVNPFDPTGAVSRSKPRDRRLHRNWSGQAPAQAERKRGGPLAQAMRNKLKRAGRRSRYRLRKQVVEPVFGQIKQARAQTVPVTRLRQTKGRMGADLHRTQPWQARPGQLRGLSFVPPLTPKAIWTGS